ncbi:hypothetical protein BDV96DRAFT_672838 [Lophiotrema nucula]|uniref:Uncharacterized protein n=1 Tax=Lophiotrema nucula TaxID=690887 RepID=A0A6A5YND5_9PLEO|nr:hypothetical protein BDV96DRAFT_672838 [Lophiotrema nucula]
MALLYNLPDVLKRYALTPLLLPVALPPDDQCPVCLRTYGTPNGCKPLQIDSCGHIIGSECFRSTVHRGFTRCLQDNQPLDVIEDFCWWWVKLICASWWFRTFCNWSVNLLSQDQQLLPLFNALMEDFWRDNSVGWRQLYNLWQGMMILPRLYLIGSTKLYLIVCVVYIGLRILFNVECFEFVLRRPGQHASVLSKILLAVGIDVLLIIASLVVLVTMRRRAIEGRGVVFKVMFGISTRLISVWFLWLPYGWLAPLALIWTPIIVYSISVAVVLAAGWWLPRRLW